ncbi:MAG: bacteriohemerythrin [Treponema sp.]|jgi:hemerythrin|nr:bacteriohemerythrin [Treponema sp.]
MPGDDVLVEWEDRYSVGIPFIDDQHKKLVELTNDLYKGCLLGGGEARDYFMKVIRGVVDYVKYHFAAEEKILEKVKYPGLAEHKKEHEGFIKQVVGDVKNFQEGKQFVPNVFVRYLKDWILTHIAVQDKQYADFIINLKKQGGLNLGSQS